MRGKFIIFIAIVFIATVGFFWFVESRRQRLNVLPPTGASPPDPSLPPSVVTGVRHDATSIQKTFPQALVQFLVSTNTNVLLESDRIVKTLGFSGEPTSFTGSRGVFYVWSAGASSLSIGGDPVEITFSKGTKPDPSGPATLGELEAVATSFVDSLGLVKKPLETVALPPRFILPSDSTSTDPSWFGQASMIQFNYRYTLESAPLFTRLPDTPSISVQVSKNKEVVGLVAYWFPQATKQNASVAIIPFQEALSRLTTGQGVVVSVDTTTQESLDDFARYQVQSDTIVDAQLGYYYSPGVALLSPVVVFTGQSRDIQTNRIVQTAIVLKASP